MTRRSFVNTAVAAGPLLPIAFSQQFPSPAPAGRHVPGPALAKRPNVLWILGDQFRAQALQSNGDPNSRTSNLTRAEVNGVSFTNHVSGFPLCCPFRGSMLTGRYPHHCV